MNRYAEEAYWNNVTIEYYASSEHNLSVSKHVGSDKALVITLLAIMAVLVVVSTCIHLFSFGNKGDAQEEVFESSFQYEKAILKRKERWAQWASIFSAPRTYNALNLTPPALENAYEAYGKPITENMRIFNGLKVILSFYILLGNTYLYCYYSIVADPLQADSFRHSFAFLIVTGSLFAIPLLIWIAGFTHAFSFL